jgi:hypothetical protein
MTRSEGLAQLAEAAHIPIRELEQMNPIDFVRLCLHEGSDDPIDNIIKACHLFGPYTYQNLLALGTSRVKPMLEMIPEQRSEASSISSDNSSVCLPELEVAITAETIHAVTTLTEEISAKEIPTVETPVLEIPAIETPAVETPAQPKEIQEPPRVVVVGCCGCNPFSGAKT